MGDFLGAMYSERTRGARPSRLVTRTGSLVSVRLSSGAYDPGRGDAGELVAEVRRLDSGRAFLGVRVGGGFGSPALLEWTNVEGLKTSQESPHTATVLADLCSALETLGELVTPAGKDALAAGRLLLSSAAMRRALGLPALPAFPLEDPESRALAAIRAANDDAYELYETTGDERLRTVM